MKFTWKLWGGFGVISKEKFWKAENHSSPRQGGNLTSPPGQAAPPPAHALPTLWRALVGRWQP